MTRRESDGQTPIPSYLEIANAYKDILLHNEKSGLGGALALVLLSDTGTDQSEPPLIDRLEQKTIEGEMTAELDDLVYSDVFAKIGIRLIPSQGQLTISDQAYNMADLLPRIEDISLFERFLSSVSPQELAAKEGFPLLEDVIYDLRNTVIEHCRPRELDSLNEVNGEDTIPLGENALRAFIAIEPHCERLGLDNIGTQTYFESDFRTLPKAIKYWGMNVLGEFLYGEIYLYGPREIVGPAHWHRTGDQDFWKETLEFLDKMEEKERTRPLASDIRQNLIDCIDSAILEIDIPEEKPDFASQREDLVNLRAYLTGWDYDQEKLNKYIKRDNSF
jgi:hypothetical protein